MSAASDARLSSTPRKLPLRFTLRLMLVAITAMCIGLAVWTHRAREQRRIVEHTRSKHGSITYDFEPTSVNGCR